MNQQLWDIKRLITQNYCNEKELLEIKELINMKLTGEEE